MVQNLRMELMAELDQAESGEFARDMKVIRPYRSSHGVETLHWQLRAANPARVPYWDA
jgi:hypothetical protein